jgi:hypothetical protein
VLDDGHSLIPEVINFLYSSTGISAAMEEIVIPQVVISQICGDMGDNCVIVVGVYGQLISTIDVATPEVSRSSTGGQMYRDSSYFSVVVSFLGTVQLINGQPVSGHAGSTSVYMYRILTPNTVSEGAKILNPL